MCGHSSRPQSPANRKRDSAKRNFNELDVYEGIALGLLRSQFRGSPATAPLRSFDRGFGEGRVNPAQIVSGSDESLGKN